MPFPTDNDNDNSDEIINIDGAATTNTGADDAGDAGDSGAKVDRGDDFTPTDDDGDDQGDQGDKAAKGDKGTDDDAIEQEIIAKGKTAPRVTPDDIKANIVREDYFRASDGVAGREALALLNKGQSVSTVIRPHTMNPLWLLTFCVLTLRNGFTVVGKSSCASPENFDAEIGRNVARADAVQQIWPLMGYQLKEQLLQAQQPAHHPV